MKDYYLVAMILNTNQGIKAFWNQVRVQIKQKTIAESAQGVKHNGIKFSCDECDYEANTKSILNVHIE